MSSTLIQNRRGPVDRLLVLAGAVAVLFLAREVVTPLWRRLIDPWVDALAPGPRMLAGHLVVWTFPMAIFSSIALAFLIRTKRLRPLSVTRNGWRALAGGLLGGLVAVVLTLPSVRMLGIPSDAGFDAWMAAGDAVSNAYEELCSRALLFSAAWYAIENRFIAALISGAVFGLTHEQYPVWFRIVVGFVGAVWSLVYAETGNFAAPYLAHESADLVLELLLAK